MQYRRTQPRARLLKFLFFFYFHETQVVRTDASAPQTQRRSEAKGALERTPQKRRQHSCVATMCSDLSLWREAKAARRRSQRS